MYPSEIRISLPPISFSTWVKYKFLSGSLTTDTSGNNRTLTTTGTYSLQDGRNTLLLASTKDATIPSNDWSSLSDLTISGWFKTFNLANNDKLLEFKTTVIEQPYDSLPIGAISYQIGTTSDYCIILTTTGANYINFKRNITCDVLLVGGGGQGGSTDSGGGGAGGLVFVPNKSFSSGFYTINVGAGGPDDTNNNIGTGANGGDTSIIFGGSTLLIAKGGGGGGSGFHPEYAANSGGSGGGAGSLVADTTTNGKRTGGSSIQSSQTGDSGTYGNGNKGGDNNGSTTPGGAGGGGAGEAGKNNSTTTTDGLGVGGNGLAEVYIGSTPYDFKTLFNLTTNTLDPNYVGQYVASDDKIYFAGGGGGGHTQINGTFYDRAGGKGGGGVGKGSGNGTNAMSKTGGGGGGAGAGYGQGGNGGSGIVIIKYNASVEKNILIKKVNTDLSFQINNTQVYSTPSNNNTWTHILWNIKNSTNTPFVRISTTVEGTENTYTYTALSSSTYINKLGSTTNTGSIYINDFRIVAIPLTPAIKYDLFNEYGSYKTLVDDVQLATKQNTLTAGTGITINNNTISTAWENTGGNIRYYSSLNQGNVGIGVSNPNTYRLDVGGTMNANTIYENGTSLVNKYSPLNHNHDSAYSPIGHTHSYLPLSGGTLTGDLTVNGTTIYRGNTYLQDGLLSFTNNSFTTGKIQFGIGDWQIYPGSYIQAIGRNTGDTTGNRMEFWVNPIAGGTYNGYYFTGSGVGINTLPTGLYKLRIDGDVLIDNGSVLEMRNGANFKYRMKVYGNENDGNECNFVWWIWKVSTQTWNVMCFIEDDRPWNTIVNPAIAFTGQHRCVSDNKQIYSSNYIGYIVSSDGKYKDIGSKYGKNNVKQNITINNALPYVSLSSKAYDKSVFGIISDRMEDEDEDYYRQTNGRFVSYFQKDKADHRCIINGCGEGSIWCSDYNGVLENGDYITTSPITGIGMRQDDDILHSYTVAKITMDCDFNPQLIPVEVIKQSEYNYWGTSNMDIGGSNIDVPILYNGTSNMLDEYGNAVYEYKLDESSNIVYDWEYDMKYITLNGDIVDREYYSSNLDHTYRMAFCGATYKCS